MRKVGLFVLGICMCTMSPAQADRVDPQLDMCLEYLSCMASMAYYFLVPAQDQDIAKQICDAHSPNFVQMATQQESGLDIYYAKLGWNLGLTHGEDMNIAGNQDQMSREEFIYLMNANLGEYAVRECKRFGFSTLTPASTEYYALNIDESSNVNALYFLAPLTVCPEGGLSRSTAPFLIDSCYIETFSDDTGSGVYSPVCQYTR